MNQPQTFTSLGIMSGSSLDGLDFCCAKFWQEKEQWKYEIVGSKTELFKNDWSKRLLKAANLNGRDLALVDREFGNYLGTRAAHFIAEEKLSIDFISSHGHTVFHQSDKHLSLQIGHGSFLAAASKEKVICDFRSLDTALGGEGAPLVPLTEHFLFPDFKVFLNLGGIANLSLHQKSKNEVIGFDVCPANQVLNKLTETYFNLPYDSEGEIAKQGKSNRALKEKLQQVSYFSMPPPKSLGREFLDEILWDLIEAEDLKAEDKIRSYTEFVAENIDQSLPKELKKEKILVSGGGTHNHFLMNYLKDIGLIPEVRKELIDQKEALCFAFLGVLRVKEEINTFSTVTGATKDSCGGAVYLP